MEDGVPLRGLTVDATGCDVGDGLVVAGYYWFGSLNLFALLDGALVGTRVGV